MLQTCFTILKIAVYYCLRSSETNCFRDLSFSNFNSFQTLIPNFTRLHAYGFYTRLQNMNLLLHKLELSKKMYSLIFSTCLRITHFTLSGPGLLVPLKVHGGGGGSLCPSLDLWHLNSFRYEICHMTKSEHAKLKNGFHF